MGLWSGVGSVVCSGAVEWGWVVGVGLGSGVGSGVGSGGWEWGWECGV